MVTYNNIHSERARLGISRVELAEKLGVSKDSIRNWETGRSDIRGSNLLQIADTFECSVDYLLGRSNDRLLHSPVNK